MKSALLLPLLGALLYPLLYLVMWLLCPWRLYRVTVSVQIGDEWFPRSETVAALCSLFAGWSVLHRVHQVNRLLHSHSLIRLVSVERVRPPKRLFASLLPD